MKNVADIYPLTPTQAGILFHTLRSPEEEVYFQQISCTLEGRLDITKFKQAWDEVVNRHPALRTIFLWEEVDEPLQVVREKVTVPWEVIDLRGSTPNEQTDQLEDLRLTYRERGFNLTKAPILHMVLVQLADERFQFIWNFHHILTDGWSTHLVLNEAFTTYESIVRGKQINPSPARPFRDYISWLMQQDPEAAERYWRDQLKGFADPTPLQVDKLSLGKAIKHGEFSLELNSATTSVLREIAKRNRITLNTVILGAWGILLSRYSGDDDVVFGTTLSGRPADLRGVENMVGMFINTLPLRVKVKEDDQLLPWLHHLQDKQLEIRQYEYSSLAKVQRWSDVPPGQALFDSIVVFENYPVDELNERTLQVDNIYYREQSNYPIALLVSPRDTLRLLVIYDQGRFEADTIERMLGHLQNLLSGIAANSDQKLGDLTLLDSAEYQQIVSGWNNTKIPLGPHIWVHDQIAEVAKQTPHAIAVAANGQELTYAELDTLTNQLAQHIIRQGTKSGTPIGLYVDRSLAMIVGIVGILKAGCSYVPLDPAYPAQRVEYILSDTQAPLVVTQPHLAPQLNLPGNKYLVLDNEWSQIKDEPSDSPQINLDGSNLAYIIHTSGSTGRPKGVMITHDNLFHSTAARQNYYNEKVGSFLLLSSFSFDSSVAGIFWTLCSGGKLVLPPTRIEQDMLQMAAIIADWEITHTLCLPSLYMLLLELADTHKLSTLQTVIVAGEACPSELVRRHFSDLPQAKLYNEYGPTETTVWSTAYEIPSGYDGERVPIGKPIPNVQNYILDQSARPVPIGVPGELCIGGAGVSSGYLNDPELTSQKFVLRTFNGEPPGRLYNTGDSARYLTDGNIEFLGRIDQQVKIRGNRVELGEIESILRRIPGFKENVVVSQKDRLIAYVIPDSTQPLPTDWRSYLTDYLPNYMIPSHLVTMEAFPQTPNGKLDRKALPIPEADKTSKAFVAPSTGTEKALAEIWKDILGVERVGIHDDFFDLGGDSLISIRVFARIADEFEVNLPLSVLFTETTIQQLAARISKVSDNEDAWSLLVPIQPDGNRPPFFCIHGITGDVLWFRRLGQLMAPNQPFYGIQASGLDGTGPAYDSIEQMAAVYLEEIKKVQPVGPYYFGGASLGGTIAIEMAHQLLDIGEEVALLVMFDHAPNLNENNNGGITDLVAGGGQIMRNLPHWAAAMRDSGSEAVVQRLQRKARVAWKKSFSLFGREENKPVDSSDLLDYGGELPDFRQRMIESHWNALNQYSARPYDKPVLLLRAKAQPLLSTKNSETIWAALAKDKLTTITVPGSHEGMFREPNVHTLARELAAQLELVHRAQREE